MPFQFLCPQGHLLEGIESMVGQQCQCPVCGMAFLVPAPAGYVPPQPYGQPAAGPAPGYAPPGFSQPGYPPSPYGQAAYGQPGQGYPGGPPPAEPAGVPAGYAAPQADAPPAISTATGASPAASTATAPSPPPATVKQEEPPEPKPEEDPNRIVRIPCPKGHELQTPMSMIGMDAMCPECSEQFTLRYEDSLEYKAEQAIERERREEEFNRRVLKWSIIAAVIVVLGLITLILIAALSGPEEPEEEHSLVPATAPADAAGSPRPAADERGRATDGEVPAEGAVEE
jgi:hypothetical protein